ncbi:MAG: DUF1573 domain-containing protein [Bacteroidota bacterium]
MRVLLIVCLFAFGWTACGDDAGNMAGAEKTVEEIKAESKINNAKIVRNPVSADVPEDTVNVARMEFAQEDFDFGTITEGEVVEHVYTFTNTGKVPLVISNARSTCGCTVPEKPDGPVAPGETGEIKVKFNTKGKVNKQEKPIIITANTYPKETRVYLRGFVERKANDKTAATN